jgi:hypothetical protein
VTPSRLGSGAALPLFTGFLDQHEHLGIQVDVQTSAVMAGAGGASGPAQDVRHQPYSAMQESFSVAIYLVLTFDISKECTLVVQWYSVLVAMHEIHQK